MERNAYDAEETASIQQINELIDIIDPENKIYIKTKKLLGEMQKDKKNNNNNNYNNNDNYKQKNYRNL